MVHKSAKVAGQGKMMVELTELGNPISAEEWADIKDRYYPKRGGWAQRALEFSPEYYALRAKGWKVGRYEYWIHFGPWPEKGVILFKDDPCYPYGSDHQVLQLAEDDKRIQIC